MKLFMLKKPTLKKSWLLSSQFQSNIIPDTKFASDLKKYRGASWQMRPGVISSIS